MLNFAGPIGPIELPLWVMYTIAAIFLGIILVSLAAFVLLFFIIKSLRKSNSKNNAIDGNNIANSNTNLNTNSPGSNLVPTQNTDQTNYVTGLLIDVENSRPLQHRSWCLHLYA